MNPFIAIAGEVLKNAFVGNCNFENDTSYPVLIVDHDGTRMLYPGTSQGNYLVKGFSVDLILKLSDSKEVKINFPASKFENRTHKMSKVFAGYIDEMKTQLEVSGVTSKWCLVHSHPGGYEEERTFKMEIKNSWKKCRETGNEFEAKVGAMIKAVELNTSFKRFTKLTRVDEHEQKLTESWTRKFKDPCYLWQENIVIKTDQPPPFDELVIPTPHTAQTSTFAEPGRNEFYYTKRY